MGTNLIIIGGGIAGLAAATLLAEQGHQVSLIEKKRFIGGRVYSIQDRVTGEWVDNGQHALMGCYHETIRLLKRLGTLDGITLQDQTSIYYRSAKGWRDHLHTSWLPSPLHFLHALIRMKHFTNADLISALRFGLALRLSKPKPNESVAGLCSRWKQSYRLTQHLWYPLAISALNESPDQASAPLFCRVVSEAFMGNKSDSRFGYPIVPLQKLHGESAIQYIEDRGGKIYTNCRVTALHFEDDIVKTVQLSNGDKIPCEHAISAVPNTALQTILHNSSLPSPYHIPELSDSAILSVYVWFEKALSEEEVCCLCDCTFEWAFHRYNFMPKEECSFGYSVGLVLSAANHAKKWSRETIIKYALADLHATYPESKDIQVKATKVFWEPKATFAPYTGIDQDRPGAATPYQNFWLAGDWTATGLPATIESAALSGHKAAECVLHAMEH